MARPMVPAKNNNQEAPETLVTFLRFLWRA
jgi:hypothetical protein